MDEMQIRTVEDIERFLTEPTSAQLKLQGNKDDFDKWIEHVACNGCMRRRSVITFVF